MGNIGDLNVAASEPVNTAAAVQRLEAHCQALLTALPSGVRGVGAARQLLTAIPTACRLGWSNLTLSAPDLFRMLHRSGLISRVPGDSDMPAAVRLVAAVSGLVTKRSERRWTVWFGCACDPEHPLGASVRNAVTRTMLDRSPMDELVKPTSSLKLDRDRLSDELQAASESLSSLAGERDHLIEELLQSRDERDSLASEIDRLAEELDSCHESLARSRAEADAAKREQAALEQERESLRAALTSSAAELKALRDEFASVKGSLARSERVERSTSARLKAAEKEHELELKDNARRHAIDGADLRERIEVLGKAARQAESRAKWLETDRDREVERRETLDEIVQEVQELLSLPIFDPEQPEDFIAALNGHIKARKKETDRLLAECARELDRVIVWGIRTVITQGMVHQGHSAEDVEQLLRRRPELLESKTMEHIDAARSKLARRQVFLPDTHILQEDILST